MFFCVFSFQGEAKLVLDLILWIGDIQREWVKPNIFYIFFIF